MQNASALLLTSGATIEFKANGGLKNYTYIWRRLRTHFDNESGVREVNQLQGKGYTMLYY